MKSNDILTPLPQLKETALELVMANAPALDILTSTKLATAIALELIRAQESASKRTVSTLMDRLGIKQ